ncbi:MAG: sporulation-delaying protein SdpB family protein [Chitinophagales bacterium]|jgi:antimicrobial peptide system SdpB family protein
MNQIIQKLSNTCVYNNKLALTRSLFAFGSLLTIVFNDINRITNSNLLNFNSNEIIYEKYSNLSIFSLFTYPFSKILCILILVSVIIGYYPRITSIFHFWVSYSICNSFIIAEGGDQIASNICLLFILILLFDNRKNHWQKSECNNKFVNIFSNLTLFMIQLQVAVLYLYAAVGKLNIDDWRNGTAVYYWFSNNYIGANGFIHKLIFPIISSRFVVLLTWGTIIIELLLFACLFANKRVKIIFLIIGTLFHLNIVFVHGLLTFFIAMFASLLLYLDDSNRVSNFITLKITYYGKKVFTFIRPTF